MSEKYIKVCPRCGSTNISISSSGFSVWDWCKDCGYGKAVSSESKNQFNFRNFPEIKKSELENFRKDIKENPIIKE